MCVSYFAFALVNILFAVSFLPAIPGTGLKSILPCHLLETFRKVYGSNSGVSQHHQILFGDSLHFVRDFLASISYATIPWEI